MIHALCGMGGKTIPHLSPLHIEPIQVNNVNNDHQEQAAVAEQRQENDQSTSLEKSQSQPTLGRSYHTLCCWPLL